MKLCKISTCFQVKANQNKSYVFLGQILPGDYTFRFESEYDNVKLNYEIIATGLSETSPKWMGLIDINKIGDTILEQE